MDKGHGEDENTNDRFRRGQEDDQSMTGPGPRNATVAPLSTSEGIGRGSLLSRRLLQFECLREHLAPAIDPSSVAS